ncbi:hypothetical protein I6H58_03120 [Rothia kristinae]|uniref:Uncharacterized protein n=1 Tax=Rothia kristinae TaxID=37923 RepID=A0A7T4MUP8_9MICC|nr:hypothetical protein [Rothia kristinae]QQC59962.1 hypothetical protein I6H58_03120 [Rothia kristinae]
MAGFRSGWVGLYVLPFTPRTGAASASGFSAFIWLRTLFTVPTDKVVAALIARMLIPAPRIASTVSCRDSSGGRKEMSANSPPTYSFQDAYPRDSQARRVQARTISSCA